MVLAAPAGAAVLVAAANSPVCMVPLQVRALIQGIKRLCERPLEKIDKGVLRKQAHQLADYCKTGAAGAARQRDSAVGAEAAAVSAGSTAATQTADQQAAHVLLHGADSLALALSPLLLQMTS